jgi:hypothetical protein
MLGRRGAQGIHFCDPRVPRNCRRQEPEDGNIAPSRASIAGLRTGSFSLANSEPVNRLFGPTPSVEWYLCKN